MTTDNRNVRFLTKPERMRIGSKTVQLFLGNEAVIAIADQSVQHAYILEHILAQEQIPFTRRRLEIGGMGPELRGNDYRVAGMSMAMVLHDTISLYARSESYGLGPSKEHIEKVKPHSAYEFEFLNIGF